MKLAQAESIAHNLVALMSPGCELISVAGSVRRQKPEVKDLEIVVLPKLTAIPDLCIDLFGAAPDIPVEAPVQLANILYEMRQNDILDYDRKIKRDGTRYKRFIVTPGSAAALVLDLFIADKNNFGNTMAIRTGNAEFSKALVTPRRAGGLMPGHLAQKDGYLWNGHDRIDCPTEEAYFAHLGIRWVEPQFRTADVIHDLLMHAIGGAQ